MAEINDKINKIKAQAIEEAPHLTHYIEEVAKEQHKQSEAPKEPTQDKKADIEADIKLLLEKDTLTENLANDSYKLLYEHLYSKNDDILENKVTEKVSKLVGVPKTVIANLYKSFKVEKKQEIIKKARNRQVSNYKNIFKILEDITLPNSYSLEQQYLHYIMKEDSIPICKVFTIDSKIIAKDRAYFEIKKVENGYQKTIIASGRDLIENKKVAGLFADTGEIFDSLKANYVTKFISEYIRLNESIIPTKIGKTETGWDKGTFYLPSLNNDCVWLDKPAQLQNRFKTKGTLDNQIEMMREMGKGRAFILLLGSLMSSLYGVIDELEKMNYTIHVGGLRGEGKSLGIKVAVSLYGIPNTSHYGKNWQATLNGLETYWETMKSVPMWCDELESAKSISDVIQSLYLFAEGTGKARAFVKEDQILEREPKTFMGVLFSTGEKNINEIINKSSLEGKNKPLGLTRRVLDLNVNNLWSGIDRNKVGSLLDRNYGLFIQKWLEIIKQDKDIMKQSFNELENKLNWRLDGKENLFYGMLTVLRFLKKHNIIDDDTYNRQFKYINDLVNDSKEEMEKTKDIGSAFLDTFASFIGQNINNFVTDFNNGDVNVVYGKITSTEVAVINNIVRDFCHKEGFVLTQVIEALSKDGNIILGNSSKTKPVQLLAGLKQRCFVFPRTAIDQDDKKEEVIPF